jgi:TrpR-related protein YerC/YecD
MKNKPPLFQTEIADQLYEAIAQLHTPDEAKKFFEDLCTPAERQALADRWHVVDSIKKEIPYRTINKETGVSVTTIGRVARTLLEGAGGYNLIYERMKKNKEI